MHENDLFRFFEHLAFGDPEGGLGDGHGEVIDLDALKLADRDLDRVYIRIAEGDLPAGELL